MKTKFIEQTRRLPKGSLQHQLGELALKLSENEGKLLVEGVNALGDHTVGVLAGYNTIGLATLKRAIPDELGRATRYVNKGMKLVLNEKGEVLKVKDLPKFLDLTERPDGHSN